MIFAAVRLGVLRKFNYERPDYNVMHYGEAFPPIYNLSNIPPNLPLFISYGGQDSLSDVLDVANLLDNLKFHDVDKLSVQFVRNYAHADYIMGVNAKDIVYNSVIAFFNRQFHTWYNTTSFVNCEPQMLCINSSNANYTYENMKCIPLVLS